MTDYAAMARRHWERHLPSRYRRIADPVTFFAELGREVAEEIDELTLELEGPDRPREPYLDRVGRLGEARARAEDVVLAERVLLAPEPNQMEATDPAIETELPTVVAPGEPGWTQVVDEEGQARETLRRGPSDR